jgi:hypothetical protein
MPSKKRKQDPPPAKEPIARQLSDETEESAAVPDSSNDTSMHGNDLSNSAELDAEAKIPAESESSESLPPVFNPAIPKFGPPGTSITPERLYGVLSDVESLLKEDNL